jgi:hypothetical protein
MIIQPESTSPENTGTARHELAVLARSWGHDITHAPRYSAQDRPSICFRGDRARHHRDRSAASGTARPRRGNCSDLVPGAAVDQLGAFRHAFEETLIPQLASRRGHWYVQAQGSLSWLSFTADLIAAGLLIDFETSAVKPSLGGDELFHLIGYALLDHDDARPDARSTGRDQLTDLGIFSARYAYQATWDLQSLLDELAGHAVSLAGMRKELRRLLITR